MLSYYFIVNSIILFYSKFFLRFEYEVQENLDKREFKIDKEKAILSSPIWIGINYANNKNMIRNYEMMPN
jgi:hypothetical protein